MTDWDELIDDVVCEAKNWFYDDAPLNEAVSALRAAIDAVVQERDNLKTVLHGNQDADYDKQLQIETLKAQLAEAEADADRLASRWVVLGQNCCSFCGKPVKWSMIIDAECPIADHAPDCPILHHQKRKEGK